MGNGRMEGRDVSPSVARTRGCIMVLRDSDSKMVSERRKGIWQLMAVKVQPRDVQLGR